MREGAYVELQHLHLLVLIELPKFTNQPEAGIINQHFERDIQVRRLLIQLPRRVRIGQIHGNRERPAARTLLHVGSKFFETRLGTRRQYNVIACVRAQVSKFPANTRRGAGNQSCWHISLSAGYGRSQSRRAPSDQSDTSAQTPSSNRKPHWKVSPASTARMAEPIRFSDR